MDSIILSTFGEIKDGKLLIYDKEGLVQTLDNSEDCKVDFILRVRKGTVSQQMRKYYFGSLLREVQKAFFAAGYEYGTDELDDKFRLKALYKEVYNEDLGKIVRERHSLKDSDTEVTTTMMSYYFEYIIRFAAQKLNWSIAFPNEILKAEDITDHQFKTIIKSK
tara:strand:+ start:37720 stop:38211 length:492 start_codon:yes stop_codon:yes gene_type:complete